MKFPKNFYWGAATSAHQVEGGNHNNWSEWEQKNAVYFAERARKKQWPDFIAASDEQNENNSFHFVCARQRRNGATKVNTVRLWRTMVRACLRQAGEASSKEIPRGLASGSFILKNYPSPLQKENYISGSACDHYNRFREDFDMAKSLGHNAHRFSIEWSRIEPEEGVFNEKEIRHYHDVIFALREYGIEPFVTVWHWTLPVWLSDKNGVLNERFPEYFERYVAKLVEFFGAEVKFWITINEPEVFALNSYYRGIWPPQKKSLFMYYRVMSKLITAHKKAYSIIKTKFPNANIGAAPNMSWFESAGGITGGILKILADKFWNFYFLRNILGNCDFIGLNYYFHNRIKGFRFNQNENKKTSDLGWEIYPEGLFHALCDLKKYRLPIYITENGVADVGDELRSDFIRGHISAMARAMQEGADVRGYFYWSLLDNFEWDKGFWPRFGLVEIDYSAKGGYAFGGKTLKRKIRPSALEYKKIIENNLYHF